MFILNITRTKNGVKYCRQTKIRGNLQIYNATNCTFNHLNGFDESNFYDFLFTLSNLITFSGNKSQFCSFEEFVWLIRANCKSSDLNWFIALEILKIDRSKSNQRLSSILSISKSTNMTQTGWCVSFGFCHI